MIIIKSPNRSLANSLVTSYVDGTQDTNAGVQVAMAWHASLAEDRDRALVSLAYAVVAHRKDHTAKTRRNYECARGRVIKLSQFEQLTIIANTILLPRDCPLTVINGELELAPRLFPGASTSGVNTQTTSTSAGDNIQRASPPVRERVLERVREMGLGPRQDLLNLETADRALHTDNTSTFDVDEAERAWARVRAAVDKIRASRNKARARAEQVRSSTFTFFPCFNQLFPVVSISRSHSILEPSCIEFNIFWQIKCIIVSTPFDCVAKKMYYTFYTI
jgi:hypothetical protein